jgi:hypothetical protein
MNTAPTIMVSSTFFDLRQIRADLYTFISDNLGYIPLLSELPSFPIDPDVDTIENCRRRVEQNADIMVLVIGGRYGSIDSKTNQSITNLEFLAARAKGIPIYVFVDKSVLSILPVWKTNPEGNFSTAVDTPKVFEFIEFVRSKERVWTFGFETAQDILTTLRIQFAYLMQDSLKVKQLLSGSGIPRFMEELRPKTLRLALEKPNAWEYRLFFQSWLDEVERRADMIREYKVGLQLEPVSYVSALNAPEWFQTQLHELSSLVESANRLINKSLQEAVGKPGEPGNAEQIVWVSRMVGRILEHTIRWAIRIRCARCERPFDLVAPEAALFADDLISQFNTFPKETLRKLEDTLSLPKSTETQMLEFRLTFTLANQSRFIQALNNAKRQYGVT